MLRSCNANPVLSLSSRKSVVKYYDGGAKARLHPNRRAVSIGIGLLLSSNSSQSALAGVEKYLKKIKLDPLESYIPGIILCQSQFHELEDMLLAENPRYQDARSLLRSGPASSLRMNIRAVAQYANESGDGKAASDAVKGCLRALEDLDSQLLGASRDASSAKKESMKTKLRASLEALDRLLATVPAPALEKGKAAALSYLDEDTAGNDPSADATDIKALEDLLPRK